MALQPGDTVSMSISPAVQLSQYTYLKPSARVQRVLGSDVDGDLERMTQDLRKMVIRAAALELGVLSDLTEALSNGDINTYIAKELEHGNQGPTSGVRQSVEPATSVRKGPQPKGPKRKS